MVEPSFTCKLRSFIFYEEDQDSNTKYKQVAGDGITMSTAHLGWEMIRDMTVGNCYTIEVTNVGVTGKDIYPT